MIERIIIQGYRIFKSIDLVPNTGLNIIVGDNNAGKSTLLEAVALALTNRVNGRPARDELNPYWFNQEQVQEYFASQSTADKLPPPEILIELYLAKSGPEVAAMGGAYNSRADNSASGVVLHIAPDPDYRQEFEDYLNDPQHPNILPVEYYQVEWRDFSLEQLTKRPKHLGLSLINTATVRSSSGVDYAMRELLGTFIDRKERAAVAVAHRRARHEITQTVLKSANDRIAQNPATHHDSDLGLHMDQSASASWETSLAAQVAELPFAMTGHGRQAAIKVAIAMSRSAATTAYTLIEEPENHQSHTSLQKLIARIATLSGDRQVFITTHSSFVLNRLGLNRLLLLHRGSRATFGTLPAETVDYYKRLSGYDTLRLVLAEKVVLVEGPADEMIFTRAYMDSHSDRVPQDDGIDVFSMAGTTLLRRVQLCHALDRKAALLRDNDGHDPEHWTKPLATWLKAGSREVFIGDKSLGTTLEPQLISANSVQTMRDFFTLSSADDVEDYMSKHKTDGALAILESPVKLSYPPYITSAIKFIE